METTIDQSQETLVHPNNPRKIVAPKPLWFLEWGIVSIIITQPHGVEKWLCGISGKGLTAR